MEMCRACLTTGKGMMPMDENFLNKYNTFTNLNLTMKDVSLYTCITCFDEAKFCMEFRDKCIESDRTLKEILLPSNKLRIVKEESDDEKHITVKKEIKLEPSDDEVELLDECYNYGEDYVKTSVKPRPLRDRLCKGKKKVQTIDNKLHCGICPKILKSPVELTSHLEQHKSEFACSLCQESLLSEPHMLGHRMTHVPHQQKRCHLCSRRFISSENLEFHCMRVHEMAEKDAPIQCKLCLSSYGTVRKLQKHIFNQHMKRKFKCEHCTKSFQHRSSLKVHIGYHNSKQFQCDLCDYSSKYSQGVQAHKLRKHTVGKAICKTCGRTFASQQLLDKHECRHRLPVVCPVCGITYQAKGKHSFNQHMKSHEAAPEFKCSECPKTFRSRGNYTAHKDRHAGTPRNRCEHCDRSFYSKSVLIKHRRTHTGEKPYVCEICSRGFTGNHNLKVHMKVHGVVNLIRKKNLEDEESVD